MTSTMDLADAYGNQRMTDGHHDVTEDHPHTLKARAALEQRIKELEADAARYRWVRANDGKDGYNPHIQSMWANCKTPYPSSDEWDAAIDRAMSESALQKMVDISQEYKLP